MKIFPAIDIKDRKCVRLVKGDFDKVAAIACSLPPPPTTKIFMNILLQKTLDFLKYAILLIHDK